MKISKTTTYGLLAAVYVAQNSKDDMVTMSRVAEEYDFSYQYLTHAVKMLLRANILESKRGIKGGYKLARPAEEISMLEIIEAMDGLLESKIVIAEFTKHTPLVTNMNSVCNDAIAKAKGILHKAKLSDMIG